MKRIFGLFISLFICLPLAATAEVTKADHDQMAQKTASLFAHINDGKIAEGYQDIFLTTVSADPQALDPLIEATKNVMTYFGEPVKYQLFSETKIGDVLVRQNYLVYTDKMPTTLIITYFKTSSGWYAYNIKLIDPVDEDYK